MLVGQAGPFAHLHSRGNSSLEFVVQPPTNGRNRMRLRLAQRLASRAASPAPFSKRRNRLGLARNEVVARSEEDPLRAELRLRWRDHFALNDYELYIPGLNPAHEGLRVAQLSDIHVGQATSDLRIRRAVMAVNASTPDLVFLTGDYVTHSPKPLPRVREVLAGLNGPVYVVLGNHDHW